MKPSLQLFLAALFAIASFGGPWVVVVYVAVVGAAGVWLYPSPPVVSLDDPSVPGKVSDTHLVTFCGSVSDDELLSAEDVAERQIQQVQGLFNLPPSPHQPHHWVFSFVLCCSGS